MMRGDVHWVDLEPTRPGEANKVRPAVIVSNDGTNEQVDLSGAGVVTIVPLTSNTKRIFEFQVFVPQGTAGLQRASKVQCEQIRSVASERVGAEIGRLPPKLLQEIDHALAMHLHLF